MDDKYFFTKKGDELANELKDKVQSFQDYVVEAGIYSTWRKNQRFYENDFFGAGATEDIVDTGAVGELKALAFNHFRNIIRHQLNQLTATTPAFDVSAGNTDVAARRASKIGKDVINYYLKVLRINKYAKRAAEKALVYGDGYIVVEWNPMLGKTITVDEKGKPVKEGDFEFTSISPYDFFYDYTVPKKEESPWFIFRTMKNKYDLAKIFPHKKEEILALQSYYDDDHYVGKSRKSNLYDHGINSPNVYVYHAYHKSTPSLSNGKMCLFVGHNECSMLYEDKNLYKEKLNYFSLSPSEMLEDSFGFTDASILRTPQEMINVIISSLATNAITAGANNIWTPTGSNLNVQEITDGMNLIETNSDKKPEVISFYEDQPGLYNLYNLSVKSMETLSAQNAAVRGNVQESPNLKSGVAIATVINMAQQYGQSLEKSYIETFEDMTSFMLDTLQYTAKSERLIAITGKMQATSVQSFIGDDLKGVSRVIVDQTNPITKQPAGKIEIAMELLKIGNITPQQFFDVINTGNLDNAVEADERLFDFIASVREKLLAGESVPPIPGINHQLYIKEIHSLLYDLEIVGNDQNQEIMANILQTIRQQLEILRQGDEIANLIHGGQTPTPKRVAVDEISPELAGKPDEIAGPVKPAAPLQ